MASPETIVHFLTRTAECLVWEADIEEHPDGLRWKMRMEDEEAAQRFLPLDVPAGRSYASVWYHSRHPEDRERTDAFGVREVRAGRDYSQTFRCRRRDGEYRWLQERVRVETRGPGCWKAVGLCTDITRQREGDEALQQSEARLREIFDCPVLGLLYWDLDGRITEANDTFLNMVGFTREELRDGKLDWRLLTAPEYRQHTAESEEELHLRGTFTPYEKEFVRRDGTRVPVLIGGNRSAESGERGVSFVLDLSAVKQADRRLRQVVSGAQCLLWQGTVKREGEQFLWQVEMFDQEAAQRFIPIRQQPGVSWEQAWYYSRPELDRRRNDETARRALEEGAERYSQEFRCVDGQGRTRWLLEDVHIRQAAPDCWELVGVCTEITARKRAELRSLVFQELGETLNRAASSEQVARLVLDAADRLIGWDACWMEQADPVEPGRHTLVSIDTVEGQRQEIPLPGPEDSLGPLAQEAIRNGHVLILRTPEQLRKGPVLAYGDENRASASLMVVPISIGQETLGAVSIQSYTLNAYDRDDLELMLSLANYAAGALRRTHAEEARRVLESQLIHAQKMEAIGRLAGGVAHDFNNMLAVINGYSNLLLQVVEPDSKARAGLLEINRAGERAAGLTRQLLAYSRKQMISPRVLDLNEVVGQMQRMLQHLVGEDIEFDLRLAAQPLRVRADSTQLDQVLVNLVVNARDAMPDGGRLLVCTEALELSRAEANLRGVTSGSYVVLSVSDTGVGMDPTLLSRIFEPFFTTKGPGQGTGLGLSTVYGSVHQSGGFITVDSTPGQGSTFRVFLPLMAEERRTPTGEEVVEGGSGTLLVVEDEEMVRKMLASLLKLSGYEVLEAADGREAVELARAHPGTISMLLTDVVMPGMNGREVAEAVEALHPGIPVLFITGYTDDAVLRAGLGGSTALLHKPFTPSQLDQRVRSLLERASSGR